MYTMLNALKNDLLWTGKDDEEVENVHDETTRNPSTAMESTEAKTDITSGSISSNSSSTLNSTTVVKGHVRRPSTASMASIASISQMSDSESDISSQENDSGVESESNKNGSSGSETNSSCSSEDGLQLQSKKAANADKATELAKRCRRHLNGLYQCLEQMTEAANYLTARYQSDIGGPV